MKKLWFRKAQSDLIVKHIIEFLKTSDFEIIKVKTEKGYQIYADDSPYYKFKKQILITVEESFEGTSVCLTKPDDVKNSISFPVLLATMFGGGYFYLQRLKIREAWENFEKSFLRHMKKLILS